MDMVRNERIREGLKQRPIEERIQEGQLNQFGHVVRKKKERKLKQLIEARMEGICENEDLRR